MSNWVGVAVSVNCGEPLGCYQGTILETDGTTITLTKAFRNGFPYPKSQVTLNSADIKDLKIIETKGESSAPEQSTVALSKAAKKPARATVCENLQANNNVPAPNNNSNNKSARGVARSKPIDITPARNKSTTHAGSGGGSGSTPKCRMGGGSGSGGGGGGGRMTALLQRNEACFGASASPADDDFDFEGNLALFDKRATFNELRNKPDLLKQTKEKYRHDENVLGGGVVGAERAWRLPAGAGVGWLRTDDGGALPALLPAARAALLGALWRSPAAHSAVALLARAAADVALKLAGGPRRLDARNAHQAPSVAALALCSEVGAAAVAAARLLHSQGARAAVALLDAGARPAPLQAELEAAAALPPVHDVALLPPADVILLALHDPARPAAEAAEAAEAPAVARALRWAGAARALVVALEPEPSAWGGAGAARASLVALLPPRLSPALGQLYLVDVAPPPEVFRPLRLTSRPPFGPSAVIPLHPDDEH